MKNLLSLVIITSLLASCTSENIESTKNIDNSTAKEKSIKTGKMLTGLQPENTANPYDIAGKIHNDILDAYLTGYHTCSTIAQVSQKVDSISALNNDLLNLETSSPIIYGDIQEIIDNPQTALEQAIASSPMTSTAKDCLSGFMASMLLWEANEYSIIHQSIISFEAAVLSNVQFSQEEKRIILTTSSITRYAIYYTKERKDKDWETSVGNRVGAVQGAVANSSAAVKRSTVAGIMVQNLQTP
nr:hypothetical protein [uncultured Flavobacterium sp.]